MCGLVGVIGKPDEDMTKAFTDMLQLDVLRGWDSTGVCAIRKNKDDPKDTYWAVVKDIDVPQYLFMHQDWDKLVGGKEAVRNNFCLMGHNRAATKGKVTHENAHPFMHGHIVLGHNGTLWTTFQLWDTANQNFDTDSETLTSAIHRKGIKWAWGKTDGAASLAFWDDSQQTLNLITNDKRPLFFGYTKDKSHLFYASEAWMIRIAAQRRKFEVEKIFKPAKDTLFTFRYNMETSEITERRKKLDPFVQQYHRHHAGFIPQRHGTKNGTTGKGSVLQLPLPGARSGRQVTPRQEPDFLAVKDMLRKKEISEEEFKQRYQNCQFCREGLDFEDAVVVDDQIAVCGHCYDFAEDNNVMIFAGM